MQGFFLGGGEGRTEGAKLGKSEMLKSRCSLVHFGHTYDTSHYFL